ncbi:efflux RND transporter permease subunit [Opitutus sp. ER46]|uniref:efflux RND transporter permease subunit n=1 Tax=Opitutus sp. ER46 TaxID=2161864 RepID=UPI000D319688|nr:efflux RND transporter permease subunit [Opitutus sp. ER46]PTX98895.1 AcrB/AcrD/AcrF family protein [Opitutus sp. ER46]
MKFLTWPLRHRQVVFVLSCFALLLGLNALLRMPRQDTPTISVYQALVAVPYPGANAAEVEQQVTRPLENYLFSFTEVNHRKTKSVTRDGLVVVTVELHEWTKDQKAFWSRLRLGLAELKATALPAATLPPIVNSDFGESVALLIGVSSPQRTYDETRRFAQRIEDGLRRVEGMGRIKRYGERNETIYVEADSQRLARFAVNLPAVSAALLLQNSTPPTGTIKAGDTETPLHTVGRLTSIADVRQQVVFSDLPHERVVRIGDIATVSRRLSDPEAFLRVNGRDDAALMISAEMQPGYNIVEFGQAVRQQINQVRSLLPSDVDVVVINDQPEVVAQSIHHFIVEFFIAIAAVVLVTVILLPLRVALIAALAIPLTIAATFCNLSLLGIELHQVSLASLIVVLGMVVDNAIVIVDNYLEKLDAGATRWDAAWRGAHELIVPVLAATVAIILAFAPLNFFLTGNSKEFLWAMPITVAVALLLSLVVALCVTPLLCYLCIRQGLKGGRQTMGARVLDRVLATYERIIRPAVAHPYLTTSLALLTIPAALLLTPVVKQELFPAAERDQFIIEIDMPLGTRLEATDRVVRQVEAVLRADQRIPKFAAFVGTAAPRVYYSFSPEFPRPSYGMLLVSTRTAKETGALAQEYFTKLVNFAPGVRIDVKRIQQGEEYGAPVEVRLSGPDLATLREYGDRIRALAQRIPGATQVRDNFRDGLAINLQVDAEMANRLGLATSLIAAQVRAGFSGFPVTQVWEHDATVPIVLRLNAAHREDYAALRSFMLGTLSTSAPVPVAEVATPVPTWQPAQIAHRNGLRTLTVLISPDARTLPSQVLAPLRRQVAELKLPPGYRIEFGGEYENQQKTYGQMLGALLASLVLIFGVILFEFKTVRETLLVMLAIPLTLFGAITGLVITHNVMSFTAGIGMISLVGIVIRNSVILVDHANHLRREEKLDATAAAIASGVRRLRPIFLTSMAAAVGMAPMLITRSPLWAPLAGAFSIGIIWSMGMTLVVIPAMYSVVMRPVAPTDDQESRS